MQKELPQCVSVNYDFDFITHIFYYGCLIFRKSSKDKSKAIWYSKGQIAVIMGKKTKIWKNGEDGKI